MSSPEMSPDPNLPVWGIRVFGVICLVLAVAAPVTLTTLRSLAARETDSTGGFLRPRLIRLPGGDFAMGSPEGVGDVDEHPQHTVRVSPFAICETEVTVGQYELVTGRRPSDCDFGCAPDQPVQNVSWEDAIGYLNTLTRQENLGRSRVGLPELVECYEEKTWAWRRECTGYRLPTEAEWEYATRAGSTGAYSFGDDEAQICEYGHVKSCTPSGETVAVKGRKPNGWGLYGVHGNVWEWVFDEYDGSFYERSPGVDPDNDNGSDSRSDKVDDSGNTVFRVFRGGSFVNSAGGARSAFRSWSWPWDRNWVNGFRCALGPRPQH